MINPWLILGIAVAWLTSLVAVGDWQNNAGHTSERTQWQARENKELTDANALIQSLQATARSKEAESAQNMATVSKNYQEILSSEGVKNEKTINDLRTGIIRLRQPDSTSQSSSGSTTSQTSASSIGCDGQAGSELSNQTAEFLYTEAARADKVVEQLAACQNVVIEDRK